MITDLPISNIFIPRNNWAVKKHIKCKKKLMNTGNYRKLKKIMHDVICKTDISKETFVSKTRYRPAVEARQIYFKRAKDMTDATLAEIGSMVHNGDHANVMYGIKQVNTVPSLIKKYDEIFNN